MLKVIFLSFHEKKCLHFISLVRQVNQDKVMVPHIYHFTCWRMTGWLSWSCLVPFVVLMIRRPKMLFNNLLFVFKNALVISAQSNHAVQYLDFLSAISPVLHGRLDSAVAVRMADCRYWKRMCSNWHDVDWPIETYFLSLYCFFIRAIFKLYIYIPTNCTQFIYFFL